MNDSSFFVVLGRPSVHGKLMSTQNALYNHLRGAFTLETDLGLHSGFFLQFLFRFETSNVHFMSRKSDISQETIDDLASKLINYLSKSVKKVPFYVKRCESISKFDRIAEHLESDL